MKKKWYKGKSFIITGASGGIGSEICRIFAPLELRMYLLDLPNPGLDELAKELPELGAEFVKIMPLDVTNRAQIQTTFKEIGEAEKYIDILYNNAGIGGTCSITNGGKFEDFQKIMAINVEGPWLVTQAALPYIGRPAPTKKYPNRLEGQLLYTSSSTGCASLPNMAAYCMSKHAVVALADSVRLEFQMQNHKIPTLCVCPAPVKTKFWKTSEDMNEWLEKYEKKGILYKMVEAKDVAKRVLKAALKNKRMVFIPRWWKGVPFGQAISRRFIGKMMIKIEQAKSDITA